MESGDAGGIIPSCRKLGVTFEGEEVTKQQVIEQDEKAPQIYTDFMCILCMKSGRATGEAEAERRRAR